MALWLVKLPCLTLVCDVSEHEKKMSPSEVEGGGIDQLNIKYFNSQPFSGKNCPLHDLNINSLDNFATHIFYIL